jgi:hypothetical protein
LLPPTAQSRLPRLRRRGAATAVATVAAMVGTAGAKAGARISAIEKNLRKTNSAWKLMQADHAPMVERLAGVDWLREKELYYWGDIDTHGFHILDLMRSRFAHAKSLMRDRETLLEHRSAWICARIGMTRAWVTRRLQLL